ncbi:hypothetical protein [Aphanothece hegewaldii]|uniref:hypothetical protein n=1 Tax=Aphanothece hegewaldii TaxID=1521625 RepID=UPI001FE804C3|nr:hypothetical protein [Aphanothece hegewaldii]
MGTSVATNILIEKESNLFTEAKIVQHKFIQLAQEINKILEEIAIGFLTIANYFSPSICGNFKSLWFEIS